MKKLLGMLLSVASINHSAYADDYAVANLAIKMTGAGQDNTYFLCVAGVGCVSIEAANHGKIFPLNPGTVNHIYLINSGNFRRYSQPLPDSCHVSINANQTLTVQGDIVKEANDNVYIDHLKCAVG